MPLNRHTLYEHRFSVLLSVCLEEELLDNMGIRNLTFCGPTRLFSVGLYHLTFLPALDKGSSFSPSSPTHVIIAILVGVEGLLVFHKVHKHRVLLQTWWGNFTCFRRMDSGKFWRRWQLYTSKTYLMCKLVSWSFKTV